MSEHDAESEKSLTSASGEPDTSVSRTQGKLLGRRAVIKAVLATTPVIMTIKSRPASAQASASSAASAKLSRPHN